MQELIEDGYLKYVAHEDLEGLAKYLIRHGNYYQMELKYIVKNKKSGF
jgi:hypothetical protein